MPDDEIDLFGVVGICPFCLTLYIDAPPLGEDCPECGADTVVDYDLYRSVMKELMDNDFLTSWSV